MRTSLLLCAVLGVLILSGACIGPSHSVDGAGTQARSVETRSIQLAIGYVANVQFAPIYVAIERGYFAERGIELEINYGWETDGVRLVGSQEIPFALASGDQVLLARSEGVPVVAFLNWWQRFPISIVALERSGIRRPSDLSGRRVGIPETFGASYVGWHAFAAENGLAPDDVKLDVIGYTQVANLTSDRVDAVVTYANNEPVQLEREGYDLIEFPVARYVSLPSNCFVTSENTLETDPELVRAFSSAFLRGLQDTLSDPESAFTVSSEYVEALEPDNETQRAVLEASLAFWSGEPLGSFDGAAWEEAVAVMREADLLHGRGQPGDAYTNAFIPDSD